MMDFLDIVCVNQKSLYTRVQNTLENVITRGRITFRHSYT